MAKPKVIILKEHGTNCEEESKYAFEKAGAEAEIVHVEDLIRNKAMLMRYQALMFPGGFSYGDDTGSGMAWANRIRNNLWDEMRLFAEQDRLIIGVCNGFQVIANLGLIPRINGYEQSIALTHNASARYMDRWVDLEFNSRCASPWTEGIGVISLPIAHGEGRFYAEQGIIAMLNKKNLVAARYAEGEACRYLGYESNPNGSVDAIAAAVDTSGRIIGMMPHPERAIDFTQLYNWQYLKEKARREKTGHAKEGPGMAIFRNAVRYFR